MGKIFSEQTSKILMWIGISLFILGFVVFFWNETFFDTGNLIKAEKVGQFGDFIGGLVGSLWALAGVVLFYVALKEQRIDFRTNQEVLKTQLNAFKQQVKEFELQRKELELTREVFSQQSETLKLQQFESTYFSMINLHHQIVNSIDITTNKKVKLPLKTITYTSRDCFNFFITELNDIYLTNLTNNEASRIDEAYKKLYLENQSDLGHYFRNLYNILKFIDKKNQGDKFFYSNLLRAQLSSSELILLFYNGISQFGKFKFKPLIEKYHFLQNIPKKQLLMKSHLEFYNKNAFEK